MLKYRLPLFFVAGSFVVMLAFGARAQETSTTGKANQLDKIVVPTDTTIPLELRNAISTRTASVGQAIYCDTIFPITVGNRIIIPSGSYVKGSVTQVVRPGRLKGKAQLGLRFDTLILPNGTTRPLRGTLSGYAGAGKETFAKKEGKIKGEGNAGSTAGKVAETTVTGAEIGTIAGAATHHVGEGLGIGSAAGAGTGLIWAALSGGKDLVLPSGTSLELQLGAPLTFDRDELEPSSRYDDGPALPRHDPEQ